PAAYASGVPELGLFPLGVVLLPTERVPLHVFEPRYKELIGECLDSGGEFGLVLADDDGLRAVGTRAAVTDVLHRFPDGRMNIVVEGGERFRLVRLTSGRSFDTAEVEPLEDEEDEADADARVLALERYSTLAAATGADAEDLDAESAALSFEIAAREGGEDLVERLRGLDRRERRLHRGHHVLVQSVRVLEHALEQVAVLQRADDVRERGHVAVADDRELRDRVALHHVDRLADLL